MVQVTVWKFDGVTSVDGDDWATDIVWRLERAGYETFVADMGAGDDPFVYGSTLHVLSGGQTSARSSDRWMSGTKRHVARLVNGRYRAVAICLGAQVVAETVQADVVEPLGAFAFGVGRISMNDAADQFQVMCHYHQVSARFGDVPGVDVVAQMGDVLQAFTYRDVRAVQFHPELTAERLDDIAAANPSWFEGVDIHPGMEKGAVPDGSSFDRWVTSWFRRG